MNNIRALEAFNRGERIYRVSKGKVYGCGLLYAFKTGWRVGTPPKCKCGLCKDPR